MERGALDYSRTPEQQAAFEAMCASVRAEILALPTPAKGFAIVSDVKINMHVLYYRDELGNSDLNRIGKPIAAKVVSSPFQWPPKDPNAPWFTCIDKVRGMVPLAALGPLPQ